MKKLFSILLITLLAVLGTACKQAPQTTPPPETQEQEEILPPETESVTTPVTLPSVFPEERDNVNFHEEATEMTVEEAQTYLKEHSNKAASQYKEAVYTVNAALAEKYIAQSKANATANEKTKELFEGIPFRFVNGEGYASRTVQNGLQIIGIYKKETDGWYQFTFFDRTLAQSSANPDNNNALNEYLRTLEFLLSDPNVTVEAIA